jgi:outer membrane receptor protein involved in Fe transport
LLPMMMPTSGAVMRIICIVDAVWGIRYFLAMRHGFWRSLSALVSGTAFAVAVAASVDFDVPAQIWVAQVGASFQGAYTPFEEPGVLRPGFVLFSATGGIKLSASTRLLVGVRNLLDVRYREVESGAQVNPGEGRAIYANMRFRVP